MAAGMAARGLSARWLTMTEPELGARCIIRRSTTRTPIITPRRSRTPARSSLDEVDPELLETYEKLGIPLQERNADGVWPGVAVDAVFDSVSVATTFKEKLERSRRDLLPDFARRCSEHPELVQKYLGSVVPLTDNFFATLNSAVFSDGSFVYVPKGVRCPMELSTYFRINAAETGQFERTLIIADEGQLCQLSGRLHRAQARREPAACRGGRAGGAGRCRDQIFDGAELVSGRRERQGRHLQFRHQARRLPRRATRRFPGPRSRPARRSPGNIRAASCAATIRSANSIPSPSPTIASRPIPAPR